MPETNIPIHGPEPIPAVPAELNSNLPTGINLEDLRPPEAGTFNPGDTLTVLQCNAKDIRDPAVGEVGSLYPEQAKTTEEHAKVFFTDIFEGLNLAERDAVSIIVMAGDSTLITPGDSGIRDSHKRSVDTGAEVIKGIRRAVAETGARPEIFTNGDKPLEVSHLRDLNVLQDGHKPNNIRFMESMIGKYGIGLGLWAAYENDTERKTREDLGVEGPDDIAERVSNIVEVSDTIAAAHRSGKPLQRVIVWNIGNYDNISPYAKSHILGVDPRDHYLPIQKGAGIVIQTAATDNARTTHIQGQEFSVS